MSKKGGERGGVIANPKISLQIYAYLQIFWKKAQCNFQKRTGAGGQGRLNFFQKTSIFGETVTPKLCSLFSFGPQDDILPSGTEMANKQPN